MQFTALPYQTDSAYWFAKIHALPGCAWLDSGKPQSDEGRFDILTALPTHTLQARDAKSFIDQINPPLAQAKNDSELPFSGGWIGLLSYEFVHPAFGLHQPQQWPAGTACFGWYDWAIVQDHQTRTCTLFFTPNCPEAVKTQALEALASALPACSFECNTFRKDEPEAQYLNNLARVKEYIHAGDCYQVNYTQRFSASFKGNAAAAYQALRKATPNPYSAYLSLANDCQILSLSQERFVYLNGRLATTSPIKGTCARGKTPTEDHQLQQDLVNSQKNRAENLMIVDLLRNDFSKHCLPHSVKTPSLFALKTYANVNHLVSTVTGELKPDISHAEFLLECFPGGSITGAPKKRAMQIIDELEQNPRSAYCGAIGYFSCNCKSDFNISIRTLLRQQDTIYCWAGGGIVADSEADQEYEESLQKVDVLLRTLSNHAD